MYQTVRESIPVIWSDDQHCVMKVLDNPTVLCQRRNGRKKKKKNITLRVFQQKEKKFKGSPDTVQNFSKPLSFKTYENI